MARGGVEGDVGEEKVGRLEGEGRWRKEVWGGAGRGSGKIVGGVEIGGW